MKLKLVFIEWLIGVLSRLHATLMRWIINLRYKRYMLINGSRTTDVFIAAYPKSGTTWLQVILYQLKTGKEFDFEHINDVSPWPRNAAVRGTEPVSDLSDPRIFKTHEPYHRVNQKSNAKYIVLIRDGRDTVVSLYHHNKHYRDANLTLRQQFTRSMLVRSSMNWFLYYRAWLENKNRLNTLVVRYEDLLYHFEDSVKRIASFCEIEYNEDDIKRVMHSSAREKMREHQEKFGEPGLHRSKVNQQFVRRGTSGEGKVTLSQKEKEKYAELYKKYLSEFDLGYH